MFENTFTEARRLTTTIPLVDIMVQNKKASLGKILSMYLQNMDDSEHHALCFIKKQVPITGTESICTWYDDPRWTDRNIPIPALKCMYGMYKMKTKGRSKEETVHMDCFEIKELNHNEPIPPYVIYRFTWGPNEEYKTEMALLRYLTDKVFHMPLFIGKEGKKLEDDKKKNTMLLVFPSTLVVN